jgi:CheY-like chemotaxis protein
MTNAHTRARPLRIVLAGDDEGTVSPLSALLVRDGYDVRGATDREAALEVLADFPPDVAILDIGMPALNGYDMAKRIASRVPNVSLIALSGWSESDHVERGRRAGFSFHVTKPVDPVCLRSILASIAHRAR